MFFCFVFELLTRVTINYIIPRQIHVHANTANAVALNNGTKTNDEKWEKKTTKKLHSRVSWKLCSHHSSCYICSFRCQLSSDFFLLSFLFYFRYCHFTFSTSVYMCSHISCFFFFLHSICLIWTHVAGALKELKHSIRICKIIHIMGCSCTLQSQHYIVRYQLTNCKI